MSTAIASPKFAELWNTVNQNMRATDMSFERALARSYARIFAGLRLNYITDKEACQLYELLLENVKAKIC